MKSGGAEFRVTATHGRRVRGWLVVALVGALLVLGVTGLYLSVRYFPTASGIHTPWAVRTARTAHHVSAFVVLGSAVLVIGATARSAWSRAAGARAAWVVGTVGMLGALGYGLARGSQLAWDQLALWAITSGSDGLPRGIWLPGTVKFVLIGDTAISRSGYRTTAWVHALILPILIAISFALVWFAARESAPQPAGECT